MWIVVCRLLLCVFAVNCVGELFKVETGGWLTMGYSIASSRRSVLPHASKSVCGV